MNDMRDSVPPRHYLLVPPEPTPNGPLHLGHVAGPFLRLDVLARFLRMRGDRPVMMTGTDAYESWVPLQSRLEGRPPLEIVTEFHQEIKAGLSTLHIELDEYINPAEEPWHSTFRMEIDRSLARLAERGAIVRETESMPCDSRSGRFVAGSFILGRCPDCRGDIAGFGCEACGASFRPDQIVEPRPRFPDDDWVWRPVDSLFMRTASRKWLERDFDRLQVGEKHRVAVRAGIARDGARVRLSTPHEWGMPLPAESPASPSSTLHSYAGCVFFARLLGELHRERIGGALNSFDAGSEVVTVTSLGADNAVCTLLAINGVTPMLAPMRPYDRVLINEFYQLGGEKFSTSRGHVIRAADVAAVPGLRVDATRYYLAGVNPEQRMTSFEPSRFLAWVSARLAGDLEERLAAAWRQLSGEPETPTDAQLRMVREALRKLDNALDSKVLCLAEAAQVVQDWVDRSGEASQTPNGAYWWLRGLALLSYPVMPDFAGHLWNRLGAVGSPSVAGFASPAAPGPSEWGRWFETVQPAEFARCLPGALR